MKTHNKVEIIKICTMKKKNQKLKHPVGIMDLSFRDGIQCLFDARGRTEDMISVARMMDDIGFWGVEIWGGKTFEVMHRCLNEDPWERIRTLKRFFRKTPLAMFMRAQNLVGTRIYPDDVAREFTRRAAENGIDVFRICDPLNDVRNFEVVASEVKSMNRHFQGCICYARTEEGADEKIFTVDYFVEKAKALEDMGADSIGIQDMSGLLTPYNAHELVSRLKSSVKVPLHLHSHCTSGMAPMTQLKAVEAGVDMIDTCLSPYAYRSSHPAIEPLVASLKGTNRDTGLSISSLAAISSLLEKEVLPKYRNMLNDENVSIIDADVLLHRIPEDMLVSLKNQLAEMNELDRMDEVLALIPKVRRDLGQVPLVAPLNNVIATQAVNNVLFDDDREKYKIMAAQTKDLCFGLFGKTPARIDPKVQKKAMSGYERGTQPVSCRPAKVLEPELEKAGKEIAGLALDKDDELLYALFPATGKRFLKWKYGREEVPENIRPVTLEQAKKTLALIESVKAGRANVYEEKNRPAKGENLRTFNVFVDDEYFEVGVEEVGGSQQIQYVRPFAPASPARVSSRPEPAPPVPPAAELRGGGKETAKEPAAQPVEENRAESVDGTPVTAPMPGLIVSIEKMAGDEVKKGENVVVLEAMKMQNSLPAPVSGVIKEIRCDSGDTVRKNQVLLIIG